MPIITHSQRLEPNEFQKVFKYIFNTHTHTHKSRRDLDSIRLLVNLVLVLAGRLKISASLC